MLIDGKKVAKEVEGKIKLEIEKLDGRRPGLAVIAVGKDPASRIYVDRKRKLCEDVGIKSMESNFKSDVAEKDLLNEIQKYNDDETVDGILVQLPLPKHISREKVLYAIDPNKDVDGFHPLNVGKLLCGYGGGFVPCTPLGVHELLKYIRVPLGGKHIVVMGRSNIVGKPLAALLMQNAHDCNATVTVVHRYSQNVKEICREADVLIVAIGQPKFIHSKMVKKGAIVIDVGINRVESVFGKKEIVGDVDFEHVEKRCSYITPVPGGVGPMTVVMLLQNTLTSFKRRLGLE